MQELCANAMIFPSFSEFSPSIIPIYNIKKKKGTDQGRSVPTAVVEEEGVKNMVDIMEEGEKVVVDQSSQDVNIIMIGNVWR